MHSWCDCPQVVKQHIQQSLLEKELLYYAYEVFGLAFVDPVSYHSWRTVDDAVAGCLVINFSFICLGHVDAGGDHASEAQRKAEV